MTRLPIILSTLLIATAANAAAPVPYEMVVGCQQNTSDGRILVADGRMLPEGARYTIKQYRPQRLEGEWSFGECRLLVTPAGRR